MSGSDPCSFDHNLLARGLEPLFGDLPKEVLEEIASLLEPRRLEAGEILMRQGDPGDSIHIVLSGRLRGSVADNGGGKRDVVEIGRGESVGETSLLTRKPHSVTWRALRDTLLVRLDQAAFVELNHTHPGLLWTVTRLVTERLQQARNGAVHIGRIRTVAVMYLDKQVDRLRFRDDLDTALGPHGSVAVLDAAAARSAGSPETWLDHLESTHRFVLMELDDGATPWSRLCLRQADRILLVAGAGGDPAPSVIERELLDSLPAESGTVCELVLIHPDGTDHPEHTSAWLKDRNLLRNHHMRRGNASDFARLGRFLAGKAVGLVLAGGGAKAFVHLGVIKALEEAGVPIDLVGGSSLGSILAAGVALGWSPDTLEENSRSAFTRRNPLTDYAFPPLISMMKGKRIQKLLRRFLGERDIEDLWLPFLCITSDFSVGEMAVQRRGLLWRAVKASISLPGILPPTVVDGHLHVDGGVFDNFPVGPLRAAGAGRIVASDIWVPRRPNLGYEETPSGLRWFFEKYVLRKRGLSVPHIMTTLFRSSFLAGQERRRAAKEGADLYFSSPSGRVGLTDWKKLDDAMAAGYSHARRRLAKTDPETLAWLGAAPAGEVSDADSGMPTSGQQAS